MSEWISVKDRLPDEADEQYICYCTHLNNKSELVVALLWNGETWGECEHGGGVLNEYVTHWMPLPESPEE